MTNDLKIEQRAMEIACKAVRDFGEGCADEQEAARTLSLWRDHPAYQAALAALCDNMQPTNRPWFPHLDFAGEPMNEGCFREPYPMQEELLHLKRPDPQAKGAGHGN